MDPSGHGGGIGTNPIVNNSTVMESLEDAADAVDKFMIQQLGDGELNEDQLEAVAGGAFKLRYLNPLYWVGRLIATFIPFDC